VDRALRRSMLRIMSAEPRLVWHRPRRGGQAVEQTATGAFAIHDRHRTAEVQINRRDGILLELARGANKDDLLDFA
jgi:hypothetical protein